MPPSLLFWTVACATLLSADAALSVENGARALQVDPRASWPALTIVVTAADASLGSSYVMSAKPIVERDNNRVLYDVSATFDSGNGNKSPFSSYTASGGTVFMNYTDAGQDPLCLNSETGGYPILPINAVVRAMMDYNGKFLEVGDSLCSREYAIDAQGTSFKVCRVVKDPNKLRLTGDKSTVVISRVDNSAVPDLGSPSAGCKTVIEGSTVKTGGEGEFFTELAR
ncbi:unnamed protein product [Hyaloperonospora brassicae]|uniref:Uncharacterized protein n=1 Tax=Hyaloperonospora brassicae TaxID=162125 RepID=A0AAV0TY72_HYABA|nr:unnamed protein product [Hyaloperonospora brassicae]